MAISMYDKLDYGEYHLPTLQEMMVAPSYLTQKHEETENAFMQNQALSAEVATRFQPGIDDDAIQINTQYQEAITNDMDTLAKTGLTPAVRQRLLQRKADFTNNILPLNKAATDRELWAKAAGEAKLRDPSLIIKNPMNVSLKEWIMNPNSHNLDPISGKDIYERTRQEMIPISKYINQNVPELAHTGIPYQYFTIAKSGVSDKELASIMAQDFRNIDPTKLSTLASLVVNAARNVITSSGVYDKYGEDSDEAYQAERYATSAFNHALGSKSFGSMTDNYGLSMLRTPKGPKSPEEPGLYFPDRKGVESEIPELKELADLKKLIGKKEILKTSTPHSTIYGPAYIDTAVGEKDATNPLFKKYGIDPTNKSDKELIAEIDNKIDHYQKVNGYTTFDDDKAKVQFINKTLPSVITGSIPVYGSINDALSGKKALPKSAWFSKDLKDISDTLNGESAQSANLTNFSLRYLDNKGLLAIKTSDNVFYIKPEDVDQSEGGYYQTLRAIRSLPDAEYNKLYEDALNRYNIAVEDNDENAINALGNYLSQITSMRNTTYNSRAKTYAITTGENKPIQFQWK